MALEHRIGETGRQAPLSIEQTDHKPKKPPFLIRFSIGLVKLVLPLGVLAGAYVGYNALSSSRPEPPTRDFREKTWVVETMPTQFSTHQPLLRVYGQTEAGREVALRALAAGEVVDVASDLRLGTLVEVDTPLVSIDRFDYEGQLIEARANLLETTARIREIEAMIALEKDALIRADEQREFASRDLERADALRQRGTLSERALDDRRLLVSQREQSVEQRRRNIDVQEAKLEQQQAAIARLERRVKEAERALDNTVLTAPFTGYVTEVNAEVGRLLNSSDVAVRLIDRESVEVSFTLSDRQFGRIRESGEKIIGRDLTVNWYLGNEPVTFVGNIARLSPQISASSGGVKVFATIKPHDNGDVLRPGAFVEVLVPDRTYDSVVTVPERSLYPGDTVFVVKEERLQPRQVEVVGFATDGVLIRGGLEDGDLILLTKIAEAGEGLKVRDVNAPRPPRGKPNSEAPIAGTRPGAAPGSASAPPQRGAAQAATQN